jgi:hypothetical protein
LAEAYKITLVHLSVCGNTFHFKLKLVPSKGSGLDMRMGNKEAGRGLQNKCHHCASVCLWERFFMRERQLVVGRQGTSQGSRQGQTCMSVGTLFMLEH